MNGKVVDPRAVLKETKTTTPLIISIDVFGQPGSVWPTVCAPEAGPPAPFSRLGSSMQQCVYSERPHGGWSFTVSGLLAEQ